MLHIVTLCYALLRIVTHCYALLRIVTRIVTRIVMYCYVFPFRAMDYSPWVEREIWPFLSVAVSPKPEVTPTKIDVHACDINPYLHEFFGPIPID